MDRMFRLMARLILSAMVCGLLLGVFVAMLALSGCGGGSEEPEQTAQPVHCDAASKCA